MVCMKTALIFVLLLFTALGSATAQEVDIHSIEFDVYKTFDVINARTGRQSRIKESQGRRVKIVKKNKWAYVIKVIEKDGSVSKDSYMVAHKWARRALNIQAALHAARLKKVIDESTEPPKMEEDCQTCGLEIEVKTAGEKVKEEDLVEPDEKDVPVITDNYNWKPGCEVLAKGQGLKSADSEQLFKCIRSIQKSIAEGARDRNGQLNRKKAFKNLYSRLNKEEQKFAAHIFTAQGEAAILTSARPPRYEEMVAVMKVVENRMNASNNNRRSTRKPFNELDVILDPWQFSMYNTKDPGWRRSLDIDYRTNFSNAVHSYIKFVSSDIEPKPEVDRIYHYHANYVRPNWRSSRKKVTIEVDGKKVLGGTKTKHYFYRDIAWSKNPKTPWR